ncbi:MAG: D-sedoheptulose 7-phosphate isomerase [Saprospiraceae bacterium]|jgi:D-sedoheptulose 7-phosphate isomerase
MSPDTRITQHFDRSIAALTASLPALQADIALAAMALVDCINSGGKILICGNGGSACDSLHFSGELLNKMDMERRPLPAMSLSADVSTITSIGNDYSYDEVFSKQVEALGNPNDILVAFSTSGESANILAAINAAHNKQMRCIFLNGKSGGKMTTLKQTNDIELRVPNNETARIQEVHGLIIHCLCDLIDHHLFG